MKILFSTKSLSRSGGGVFSSCCSLSKALAKRSDINIEACGVRDKYSNSDQSNWNGVKVRYFPLIGPFAFGLGLGYKDYVLNDDHDLIHTHALDIKNHKTGKDSGV